MLNAQPLHPARTAVGGGALAQLARDEVYTFLLLNLTLRSVGATGSPIRPIAVR